MIATRQLTVYTTSDGADFDTEDEAVRHQARIDADSTITDFIATREVTTDTAATRIRNLIRDWVAFSASRAA